MTISFKVTPDVLITTFPATSPLYSPDVLQTLGVILSMIVAICARVIAPCIIGLPSGFA